ncbi:MAG TPA: TIGR00730 family Rossman fold protein [Solirubrobacteraceae bacterium]|nr:TIGR00730 family Rossman fold protein [Solirubrobacteraceae bacterium]
MAGEPTPDEEILASDVVGRISDEQRVERMARELARGFAALRHLGPAVSVFGSARTPPDSPQYATAREVGRRLGEAGFAVITGGGPGAMAAANQGAQAAGAASVGLTIDLPQEQGVNRWVGLAVPFHYFFCRKVMFVRYAGAFVVLPGGYGTFDELFEAMTLIQTRKVHHFPLILVGSEYWSGLMTWLRERVAAEGKIGVADLELVHLTDDLDEVVDRVADAADAQGMHS